jgi:D-erythronate 2-dehydrogenase
VAVFGPETEPGPAGVVGDDTLPRPQSSYGIQKFIAEQLVADYTRRGFVRGRPVRLMTVAVRPGRPNAAASSFLSGIIREPLAGLRAACPVPADTPVALASPARALDGILRAAAVTDAGWGARTAVTPPGSRRGERTRWGCGPTARSMTSCASTSAEPPSVRHHRRGASRPTLSPGPR